MLLHGAAPSVPALIASRLMHGVGAAFCSPVASSLIADAFAPEQRGLAYSIYASGLYVGTALAILASSASAFAGRAAVPGLQLGWRASAWVAGAVSALAAAALILTVPEPQRPATAVRTGGGEFGGALTGSARSIRNVLGCRSALLALCAVAARLCAGYTIISWFPAHCKARFPVGECAFAALYATAVCAGGVAASLLGGLASDALGRRSDAPNARALVPLVGSLLAAPLFLVAVTRSSLHGTMGWFFAHVLCSECWLGPTVATMLGSLPADARGTAQGLFNFVQLGGGLLQVIIAPAAARFGIGRALQVTVPVAYLASAAVFAALLRCGGDAPTPAAGAALKF
ncbi:major facilitator superfamily domain-containing protein, partial [Pavlovales sp. CCMP2436]